MRDVYYPEWIRSREEIAEDSLRIFLLQLNMDSEITTNSIIGLVSSLLHLAQSNGLDSETIAQVAYQAHCDERERMVLERELEGVPQ